MFRSQLIAILLAGGLFGQAVEPKFDFDAASLRLSAPGSGGRLGNATGGLGSTDPERVRYQGTPLFILLAEAFVLRGDQLNAPAWVRTQGYDIVAKIPPGATRPQYEAMLKNLLVDRLHIVSHYEKREFAAYDLVVAKGGVKMKASTADLPPPPPPFPADPAADAVQRQEIFARIRALGNDPDGFPGLPDNNVAAQSTTMQGYTRINARGQTSASIAKTLELRLNGGPGPLAAGGARVTDKTGLTGLYEFKLQYASGPLSDDPLPDLFSAVQSQLGLKLEKGTAQLDVLVIDHIEKTPADN